METLDDVVVAAEYFFISPASSCEKTELQSGCHWTGLTLVETTLASFRSTLIPDEPWNADAIQRKLTSLYETTCEPHS